MGKPPEVMWMWNFFARLRRERNRLAAAIATLALIVILSLAMAPAARARNDQPDAMPTATETVLYSFGVGGSGSSCKSVDDGINPLGSLTYVSATGLLFGATSSTNTQGNGFGTVFQIGLDGSGYMVDHFFAGPKADGSAPQHGSLTLLGDVLYGTTLAGGTNNNGTIFSLNDDGTGYSSPPLFNFPKSATNNVGDMPFSTFSAIDNVLYAMTSAGGNQGGPAGDGAIFSFDTSGDTYTRVHSFNRKRGADPHGQLILDPNGTTLYGMTSEGGKDKVGVVFSFDSIKSKYTVLHEFSCPGNQTPACIDNGDGASPDHGTLVQKNSTLFGLTTVGGRYGDGTLFAVRTDGSHFAILQHFGSPNTNDGTNPYGSLLLDGATLYGTTRYGGSKGNGTVFEIQTDGTSYDRIYNFQSGSDAANPVDNVILVGNILYGMTEAGGLCGDGAIFALDLSSLM